MKSSIVPTTAKLAASLALCTTSIIACSKVATAVNFTFNWKGDAGYSLSGSFSNEITSSGSSTK